MSRKILTAVVIVFAYSCCFSLPHASSEALQTGPETQKEKESYSIGYQVGLSIQTDGVAVDFERLIEGLKDAIGSKDPRLTTDEMKKLIVELKRKARDSGMRKHQELIVKNAAEAESFLKANRSKEGISTTESGLQYEILQEGDGAIPGAEDFVSVHYRGMFADGSEFENSYAKGGPQTVQTDGVIKGWTEALGMMKTGSKWRIFLPPHLAYGRSAMGKMIPANKVLVFELELLSIEKKGEKTSVALQSKTYPEKEATTSVEDIPNVNQH